MLFACLAFSLTVLAVGLMPQLPSVSLVVALVLFVISWSWRLRGFNLLFLIWLVVGAGRWVGAGGLV